MDKVDMLKQTIAFLEYQALKYTGPNQEQHIKDTYKHIRVLLQVIEELEH